MKPALSTRAINKIKQIVETSTKEYRKVLDSNIHIADISFEAIKSSVGTLTEEEYYILFDAFYSSASYTSSSVSYTIKQIKSGNWKGLVCVSDPKFGQFLAAVSYGALQRSTSKVVKALSTQYKSLTGLVEVDTKGRTTTRIGHIASDFSHSTTPLLEKLKDIYKRLPMLAGNKIISQAMLLQASHSADISYSFNRSDVDTKEFASSLGRGVILVTLQSDAKNADLAKLEAAISARVLKYINSSEFAQDIITNPGSNTIIQDIEYLFRKALDPKTKAPTKHSKKPVIKSNVKTAAKSVALPFSTPQIRTVQGQFYSLTSLQALINTHLQDVVSANMGEGDRRDILNYRTGRFAASAKVERVSQSREGMITAFYSYMKNPYATFSDGGKQQYPKTRDPKLLISKSIREIAATKVAYRMRAVSV